MQSHAILGVCFIIIISLIFFSCNEPTETKIGVKSNPAFADIAPIIFKNCTPCHRAGESGPFELMTYEDVKKNANKIKFVTQTRYMPPWPADVSYTHFIGERKLTGAEIELINNLEFGNVLFLLMLVFAFLFLIGLISPKISLFWYRHERTRKRSAQVYGLFLITFIILFGLYITA